MVSSGGAKNRFLRGVITNDLVRLGIDFDDAYAIARTIRDLLHDRIEVSTAELRDLVEQQLEKVFGADVVARLTAGGLAAAPIRVIYHGERQPFSRGLLARSVLAAGLELDRAYRLVSELESDLRGEQVTVLHSDEIARRMAELLERVEGLDVSRRYSLARRIHRLPRPLVLYVGGASGTGKSTLALELAPLLRIYRVIATDTIRQVMRMVFTPAILPALHRSSFEASLATERADASRADAGPDALVASFDEQATRVCVGVRAVVERAIAENMSIVVEGVHLHPAIVPFPDLEGAAYQVPLLLSTMNAETHRPRFLMRSGGGRRRAERYLEGFGAIRSIHDHLLQQAEAHDVPLLDTSEGEPPVDRSMRLVTGIIETRFPHIVGSDWSSPGPPVPTLLLCIDGLADHPVRALGGRTPLQAAVTPELDRLAREGRCGVADSVSPGVVPDTAAGSLAVFGQSPLALKRGPVEALGAGIELRAGDLALRANLATLDDKGKIIDRRAGRIREGATDLAAALDRLDLPGDLGGEVEVRVRASTEHRLAVVLRGEGLSSAIHGSDPGEGAGTVAPLVPSADDPEDERAVHTAHLLALFEQEARRVLADHPVNRKRVRKGLAAANAILTRGAGRVHRLVALEHAGEPLRLTCITGDRTILGIAKLLNAQIVRKSGMTANLDTDLSAKFEAAAGALTSADLVVLHVKGADIAAHDRRPDLKVDFLERLDKELARLRDEHDGPLRIAVTADHATLSESGQHASDPVPVVMWGDGIEADSVETFDEQAAAGGAMQRFPLQMLMGRLFD